MKLLTLNEIAQVSGGDAAATRQAGQNSWGEWPSAPEPTQWECFMDLVQGIFSNRFRSDCP